MRLEIGELKWLQLLVRRWQTVHRKCRMVVTDGSRAWHLKKFKHRGRSLVCFKRPGLTNVDWHKVATRLPWKLASFADRPAIKKRRWHTKISGRWVDSTVREKAWREREREGEREGEREKERERKRERRLREKERERKEERKKEREREQDTRRKADRTTKGRTWTDLTFNVREITSEILFGVSVGCHCQAGRQGVANRPSSGCHCIVNYSNDSSTCQSRFQLTLITILCATQESLATEQVPVSNDLLNTWNVKYTAAGSWCNQAAGRQ